MYAFMHIEALTEKQRIWAWLSLADKVRIEAVRGKLGAGEARPSISSVVLEAIRRGLTSLESELAGRG